MRVLVVRHRPHKPDWEGDVVEEKVCSACDKVLPYSAFSKKASAKDGHSSKCKSCHNLYVRTVWYPKNTSKHLESVKNYKKSNPLRVKAWGLGVSYEEVAELFNSEDPVCQVCGSKENICIDHCHKTQVVRGLLCRNCNTAIGMLGDDPITVMPKLDTIRNYLEAFVKRTIV